MSDVSSLFAKKKKKKKSKKKDTKSSKAKSASASAADPGTASTANGSSSTGWSDATTTQYKSLFGSKAPKLKTQLEKESPKKDVKFEGMTEEKYKNHVDQETLKKEFHKARKLAELKAKKAAEISANPVVKAASTPVKTSWLAKKKQSQAAATGSIRSQIGNATHFPSLGGKTKKAVVSGAWGSVDVDEETIREVEQVLHEQDPEVIKQRAEEAARQAKLDEIKRNTWSPSEEEGGVDESLDDEKITKSIKSMIREYLNIDDKAEAMLCIKELRNPSKHDFVCQRMFEEAFETLGGEDDLRKITSLIVSMRRSKPYLLTKEQLDTTISFLDECMDDIKVDIPKAPERFEIMLKYLRLKQVIPDPKGKKFILSVKFDGAKEGYDYKMGAQGMGYYLRPDVGDKAETASSTGKAKSSDPFGGARPVSMKKPDPFGGAKPVVKKSDPFGGARPVSVKSDPFGGAEPVKTAKADPFGGAKPVSAKTDPFGGAKPVKTRADPFGGAKPVKTKIDPFGGAKPVMAKTDPFGGAKPVKTKTDPFGGAKPVRAKVDPFGGAKPVEEKKAEANNVAPAAPAAPAAPSAPADSESASDLKALYGAKKKKKKKKKGYVA